MNRHLFCLLLGLSSLPLSAQLTGIVLSNSPTPEAVKAGKLLQYYLGKMVNQPFPLLQEQSISGVQQPIFIGNHPAAAKFGLQIPDSLLDDAYFLAGNDQAFAIAGGGELGLEYGVYSLLEMLGCRMLSPQDSIIPTIKKLQLPVMAGRVEKPAFPYRELWYEPAFNEKWARWHKLKTNPKKNEEWGLFVHTFEKLCPKDQYFAEHPEYFAFNGAQRSTGQLCLSNDSVRQIVSASLAKLKQDKPAAKYWSVSQNDNYDYCKCPRCAAADRYYGSPAGTLLAFVNRIAKEHPDITISTLAYQYTRQAPKNILPENNVSICLCSIECNRGNSIEAGCPDFARDVREWALLTPNLMIWDYVVQFRSYISPFPNWHTLQPNLQFFQKNGVKMMFEQGSGHSRSEFSDMRAYLLAKLMWNPQANMDSILTDFGTAYYGAAKPSIWEYIHDLSENLAQNGNRLWIYDVPQNEPFLDFALLNKHYDKLLGGISQLKGDKAKIRKIDEASLPLWFALLEKTKSDTTQLNRSLAGGLTSGLDFFVKSCEQNGIETLHENRYPPDEYKRDYLNFVEKYKQAAGSRSKDIILAQPASKSYAKGDPKELINRLVGETDYRYNWLGFQGSDLVATVALDDSLISNISVGFLQDQASWVFFPAKVNIEVSKDGRKFRSLHQEKITLAADGKKSTYTVSKRIKPQKARFVRITAINIKQCPDWHTCNGNPCWIFADEIIIR